MATPALLRRFWPYMARYKGILCFDLFCAALTSVCELVLPLIMRSITNMGVNDLSSLTVSYILRVGALYLVLRLIDGAANYFMANTGHVMGARIETDMRRDAFDHLQKLSDSYFANTKVGQIMGRITNDLFDVTEFAHHCPEEFFIAGLKGVISFIILAGMNVWLTLIVFAVVPVMVICCTRFNHMVRATFLKQRRHIGELNARIEDSLLGERVVKAFGGEDLEREKFEQDNGRFLDIKKETYRWMAAFNTTTRLFDGLMYLVVIVAGGLFMLYGKIEPGDLVAYMLYVTTLLSTIRRIIEFAEQFQRGMTGIERFCEIMDADVDIFDDENAKPLENVQGRITFEHVSFEYPDDHNKVLHDLSLDVRPGEKLALEPDVADARLLPAQNLSNDVGDLRLALGQMASDHFVVEVLPHAADPAVHHRPERGVLLPEHLPPMGHSAQHHRRQRLLPGQEASEQLRLHLAPTQVGLHDAVRPLPPGRQEHHADVGLCVFQQAGSVEQTAGAVWRMVHPNTDGVPRAAGPQSLRCLQIPLPVPVRGLIITITPPAQQVPPVRTQRFSDIPHIQSQGQDQYITRTAAQGDGLPFQGRLPPLGPLDLVDLLSRGRFSVIEADDRSRCHISAVLCAAENESEAFPSAPAAALGHPQGTAG